MSRCYTIESVKDGLNYHSEMGRIAGVSVSYTLTQPVFHIITNGGRMYDFTTAEAYAFIQGLKAAVDAEVRIEYRDGDRTAEAFVPPF